MARAGTYVWTPTGHTIHRTFDGVRTLCNRPVADELPTRAEVNYYAHCKRCEAHF